MARPKTTFRPRADVGNILALTAVFGDWPDFHDAEIVRFTLQRESASAWIEIVAHVFGSLADGDEIIHDRHTLVTLHFGDVELRKLEDFNGQNAIDDLRIEAGEPGQKRFIVDIPENNGCDATFGCESIDVVSVEPYTLEQRRLDGSVYAAKPEPEPNDPSDPFKAFKQEVDLKFVLRACHEASHAVAALVGRVPFGCITIHATKGNEGHIGGKNLVGIEGLRLKGVDPDPYGIVALSGVVGEMLCEDYEHFDARKAVDRLFNDNPGDTEYLKLFKGDRRKEALRLATLSETLLRTHATSIARLGTALLKQGCYGASAARDLLQLGDFHFIEQPCDSCKGYLQMASHNKKR